MKTNTMEKEDTYGLLSMQAGSVPLVGVKVSGNIVGRAAKVRVQQHFINAFAGPIEALYKFPLPERSSLCGFIASVGDRTFTGKVEEREKAYEKYDDALMQGHGGFLLDQDRPNIFTLSVGNMKPQISALITIEYTIMLDTSGGETRFFLPTTISPRYVPANTPDVNGVPTDYIVNPPVLTSAPYGLSVELTLHDKEHIASVESPSHPIKTQNAQDSFQVSFSAERVAMDRDFVLTFTRKEDFLNACYYQRSGKDLFFQLDLFLSGGTSIKQPRNGRAREVIFLVDCSGSMDGESIGQAKKALDIFLKGLDGDVSFNIFRFANTFESLFPNTMLYSSDSLAKATQYLDNMRADGGTEMLAPFKAIYADEVPPNCTRSIVFLTDGEVGNEQEILDLVRDNADSTSVFSVGIGSGPNEYLIKEVALSSGGWYEMISPGERIEPKVLGMYKKVISGSVRDIRIDWNQAVEQTPALPVIYSDNAATVFGRLRNGFTVPSHVKITGKIDGVERTWKIPFFEIHATENQLPLLWAREKIHDLESGKEEEMEDSTESIVALSKEFGIISSQTSFVAIEEREEKDRAFDSIVQVKVPIMLTKGWGGSVGGSLNECIPVDHERYDEGPVYMRQAPASSLPLFDEAKRELTETDTRTNLLMEILSCQRAEGGFSINAELAGKLGISFQELVKAADRMSCGPSREIVHMLIEAHTKLDETGYLLSKTGYDEYSDRIHRLLWELGDIIRQMSPDRIPDSFIVVCTAFIILYLQEKVSDLRCNWEGVLQKSAGWLDERCGRLRPVIDGENLRSWLQRNIIGKIVS